MIDTAKLKRKVARWRDLANQLEQKHKGNEQDYTYLAGYLLGTCGVPDELLKLN